MKLLLDTHILLWAAVAPARLPESAMTLMANPENNLLFSPVSLWEVAIKSALNRPDFKVDAHVLHQGLIAAGYVELPVTADHAVATGDLPDIHKDPFDRLLLAQAKCEDIVLLTADAMLAKYPAPVRRV